MTNYPAWIAYPPIPIINDPSSMIKKLRKNIVYLTNFETWVLSWRDLRCLLTRWPTDLLVRPLSTSSAYDRKINCWNMSYFFICQIFIVFLNLIVIYSIVMDVFTCVRQNQTPSFVFGSFLYTWIYWPGEDYEHCDSS